MQVTGTFQFTSWNETPYHELEDGHKLTHAAVTNAFKGGIDGEGTLGYLMAYQGEGLAHFVGYERIIGKMGEKSGSFVLQHSGLFKDGKVQSSLSVVPDSGTGDLAGLRGTGSYVARHDVKDTPFMLEVSFE